MLQVEKVVMLDIDGVLNSTRAMTACREFNSDICPPFHVPLDGDRVGAGLVNRACRETSAKIVVISTWLYMVGLDFTMDWLARIGIDPDLFHNDPTVRYEHDQDKSKAVEEWLARHPTVTTDNLVVIDDDATLFVDHSKLRKRRIAVTEDDGIQLRHYKRVIQLLGKAG